MNQIGTEQLLSQIRTFSQTLKTPTPPSMDTATSGVDFKNLMKTTLDSVNDAQKTSAKLKMDFELGRTNNLAEVMIASQKADLSFRAVSEVRNKLVTAYQDIMNMPV